MYILFRDTQRSTRERHETYILEEVAEVTVDTMVA